MDLETENRIAAILMKEAAEMRRQAEKEGVHAYLRQPNARFRPNSRFLTATVLGVQQANRAVEVNEMWSVRQKELELDNKLKGRVGSRSSSGERHGSSGKRHGSSGERHGGSSDSQRSTSRRHAYAEPSSSIGSSSSKRTIRECYSRGHEDSKDDDIDEFLHSRVKRGRGAVGSRMDEPGPYLPTRIDTTEDQSTDSDRWERRVVLGPHKPPSLHSSKYDEEESLSKKNKSKEKSRDKKKKKRRDEKRSKRHA